MLGREALMRLSLVISFPPGARGTLKSTLMKTRLPWRFRSLIDSVLILSHDARCEAADGVKTTSIDTSVDAARRRACATSGGWEGYFTMPKDRRYFSGSFWG